MLTRITGREEMHFTLKLLFSFVTCFLIILSLVVIPATAVKVEGAKIMLDVEPGTTYVFPMAISIKAEDTASDYAVDVLGFGQSEEGGSYTQLTAADDMGPYSARSFVTVESPVIHLAPGQRKEFNATISVPAHVGDGGRYAIIHIHPAETGSGQASFATAIIVPVMLTVKNSHLVETGAITSIDVGDVAAGRPITVATTLRNTGNHHYYGVANHITIKDSAGNTVATAHANPVPSAVIPGQSVRYAASVSTPLSLGTYSVISDMVLESGTMLDSSSTTFSIEEAYTPPFIETSVKVTVDSPAVLTVPEGTITISFPQGSVLSETTVTVKPYTAPLPVLPDGATSGTTAFSVEGLSGLLAKDATVTVRYSHGDLTAAGGAAGNLVLARYDRTDSKWTVLPTTVNTNAMTLATTTNRFSTWAVLAVKGGGESTLPKPAGTFSLGMNPLLICGCIAIALLLAAIRKRG